MSLLLVKIETLQMVMSARAPAAYSGAGLISQIQRPTGTLRLDDDLGVPFWVPRGLLKR